MTFAESIPIPTNDLLRYVDIRVQLHGNEVAWVRSIAGSDENPVVSIGLGALTMFGHLDVVRERLGALLDVVDAARAHPELWPEVGMRKVSERRWVRGRPNPFVALGNGPAGPEFGRRADTSIAPDKLAEG